MGAALWLVGGARGLLLAAAVVVWDIVRPPTPRQLLAVAAALLALVPCVILAGGLPSARTISPLLIASDLTPHLLAGAGLALLVLGIVRDRTADGVHSSDPPPAARDGSPGAEGTPAGEPLPEGSAKAAG
jgi:hypothetical protein